MLRWYCAMRDVSRADQVQKATERLVAAGSHVVGAVLNGVPAPHYARRYGEYSFHLQMNGTNLRIGIA